MTENTGKTGKRAKKAGSRPVGRPSLYRPEYAEQARKICLLGATDAELASVFGVSESTLNLWKTEHPEFSESITRGKLLADAEVADRLYQRALGYSHPAVKIMTVANQVTREEYVEHYPPDTPAASLWLRNRQPAKWRDKTQQEHSGSVQSRITVEFVRPPVRPVSDDDE